MSTRQETCETTRSCGSRNPQTDHGSVSMQESSVRYAAKLPFLVSTLVYTSSSKACLKVCLRLGSRSQKTSGKWLGVEVYRKNKVMCWYRGTKYRIVDTEIHGSTPTFVLIPEGRTYEHDRAHAMFAPIHDCRVCEVDRPRKRN